MSLKKIELFGFKSFSDKTEIVFEPGVTCVVGPNGCGKSNISDAIRWVLGERSAKLLRGSKMEDVIFNGTDYRKPLGFAEVHLTINNSKKILPIEYEEVVISRKIYRSGESEYFLNKTLCRYKDIQDLILDTGIGSNSYSMIEQGRIDYILQADPDERRFLIEEAAGISKFKSKKEEAIKKLERTEENLLRLGDIISEVEKNIKYAERQAKRAEKYKEQFEILKELEIRKALLELSHHENQAHSLEEKKTGIAEKQNFSHEDFIKKESALKEMQAKIQSLESDFSFGELKKIELTAKINSLRDKTYFNVERIGSLKNQWLEAENEIATSEERIKQLYFEIEKSRKEISLKESEFSEKKSDCKNIQDSIRKEYERLSDLKRSVEDMKLKQLALGKNLAEQHNERILFETRVSGSKALMDQKQNELRNLEQEITNITTQISTMKEKEILLRNQQSVIEETLGIVDENLRIKETEIDSMLSRMLKTEGRRKELQAHIDIMTGQSVHRNTNEFLRILDEHRKDSTSKLYGNSWFLKELISPKAGFEGTYKKLLAVLSEDTLVFKTIEALPEIKELATKTSTPLIASIFSQIHNASPLIPLEWKGAQLMPLKSQIEIDEKLDIFNPIYVSSKNALELLSTGIKEIIRDCQILSADGILIGPGPFVTFPKGLEIEFTEKKIAEIIPEKELIEHQLVEYEDREKRLKHEKKAMTEDRIATQQELLKIKTELESEAKLASSLQETLIRNQRKLELLNSEIHILYQEMAGYEKRLLMNSQKFQEMEKQEKSLQEEYLILTQRENEQTEKVDSEKLKVVRLETEVASMQERLRLLSSHLDQSQNSVQAETNRIEQKRKSIADGGILINNLNEENNSYSFEIDKLAKEQSEMEINLAQIKESLDAERVHFEAIRSDVESLRRALEKLRDELHQLEYQAMESNYARSSILERIRQSYKIDLAKNDGQYSISETDNRDEINLQITALKEKLESYGAVNILAVDEYNDLKNRYDFLVSQRTDLVSARDALLDAIRKINRTTKKLFEETFQQVQIYFQEFFTTLFNGGQAQLALLDEENALESGIEIMVRPPGKKLQQISLLSGGEKALTAIALLFSLFKIKPSPFCVLDEVDAPLDEANIDRFLNVLRSFLETTQFIIITHNRKTISIGDALYGVTMEETGVSKIVSVRVNQTEKSAVLLKSVEIEK